MDWNTPKKDVEQCFQSQGAKCTQAGYESLLAYEFRLLEQVHNTLQQGGDGFAISGQKVEHFMEADWTGNTLHGVTGTHVHYKRNARNVTESTYVY